MPIPAFATKEGAVRAACKVSRISLSGSREVPIQRFTVALAEAKPGDRMKMLPTVSNHPDAVRTFHRLSASTPRAPACLARYC